MEEDFLLGMPLEAALDRLRAAGIPDPVVEYTRAPRGETPSGTPRVVRWDAARLLLTAARFPDRVREDV